MPELLCPNILIRIMFLQPEVIEERDKANNKKYFLFPFVPCQKYPICKHTCSIDPGLNTYTLSEKHVKTFCINVLIMAHMNIGERSFAIGASHAG